MAWDPHTNPISYVIVEWQKSPGTARVRGAGSPQDWDQRKAYGLAGSFPVYTGSKLSEFSIEIKLATAADWAAWRAWRAAVKIDKPPAGTRPKAKSIWHPYLADLDIKAMVVQDVSQPEQDDQGIDTITIKCMQYRRPKIALSKPDGAKTEPEPQDENERRIQELRGQRDALAREKEGLLQ